MLDPASALVWVMSDPHDPKAHYEFVRSAADLAYNNAYRAEHNGSRESEMWANRVRDMLLEAERLAYREWTGRNSTAPNTQTDTE